MPAPDTEQGSAPTSSGKVARLVSTALTDTDNLPSPPEAGRIAEFDSAIARNAASFAQLAASMFYSRDRFLDDPRDRSVYESYIEPLTKAFEAAHGRITSSFYCERVIAAAVLTDRQELWYYHPSLNADQALIWDLLFESERINIEAERVLPKKSRDLQTIKGLIYAVYTKVLFRLDDDPTQAVDRAIVDLHMREVRHAREYYLRAAGRYAKFDYFLGMLAGVVVCLFLIIASAWIWMWLRFDHEIGNQMMSCLIAGSIGAIISVMSRMTFGELSLDYEADRRLLILFGGFRPVIGMVFGAVMWVLASSEVFAISAGSGPIQKRFFYTLIAFLAGFSERWAQDMLGRTADQISGHRGTQKRR